MEDILDNSTKKQIKIYTKEEALAEYSAELRPGTHLAIGEGWMPLFCAAASIVRHYNKLYNLEGEKAIRISTVKEKFGRLRVYIDIPDAPGHVTAKVYNELDGVCAVSAFTCEDCGKPGALTNHGRWLRTTCREHSPKAD